MKKKIICNAIFKNGHKMKIAIKVDKTSRILTQMNTLISAALSSMELKPGNRGVLTWGKTVVDLNECVLLSFK